MAEIEHTRRTGGGLPAHLLEQCEGNLLVSGPPLTGKDDIALRTLKAARDRGRDALLVTTTRSAPRLLNDAEGVIAVDCTPVEVDGEGITSVGSPADLTGISMPVSEFLRDAGRPVVGFDSLSTLLMYAEVEPVFRFLSVLTTQVSSTDGLGVYTISEGGHDGEIVRTFRQLFDGCVELAGDSGVAQTSGLDGIADGYHPH